MRARLAIVVLLFGIIIVPYGHGVLPVGVGVPSVLMHFADADRDIAVPSVFAALGTVAAVSSIGFGRKNLAAKTIIIISVGSFAASACGFIMASGDTTVSIATALPFALSAAWLIWWLFASTAAR
jgi:hypothetical protein